MPKHLRLPRMDECQFYNKKRLEQLHRKEEQLFVEAKDKNTLPNDLTNFEVPRSFSPVRCSYHTLVWLDVGVPMYDGMHWKWN